MRNESTTAYASGKSGRVSEYSFSVSVIEICHSAGQALKEIAFSARYGILRDVLAVAVMLGSLVLAGTVEYHRMF